jgi:uncharacterized integral membrane protein
VSAAFSGSFMPPQPLSSPFKCTGKLSSKIRESIMWIVKMVLWVLLTLILIFFASENATQEVQVQFWKWESQPLALWLVLFFAFAAGALITLLASIYKIFQIKNETRKLRKENKSIAAEVEKLRNFAREETQNFNSNKSLGN